MKWRKASEKLPINVPPDEETIQRFVVQDRDEKDYRFRVWLMSYHDLKGLSYYSKSIEWLDETPEPTRQGSEAPFPDRMTFKEMLSNLFDVSFLTGEELETISKAGEMYANGCLKAQSFSAQSERDGWEVFNENDPKTFPPVGDNYNVVWDLEDNDSPVTTTMEWDAINKRWRDLMGVPEVKSVVLYYRPLPAPPKA